LKGTDKMKGKNKFAVKFSKEILDQVEAELKFWEEQGQLICGVHDDCSLDKLPEWLDTDKLKKAQKVAKDLYMRFVRFLSLFFIAIKIHLIICKQNESVSG
jgi:hypothetical protein